LLRFAPQALKNLIGQFADRFALARISKAHVSKANISKTHVSKAYISNAWLTAFVKTKLLIGIVLLQLVGANAGAHQLHPDTKVEEGGQHSHLQIKMQLTTQVMSVSQCDVSTHTEHDFLAAHAPSVNHGVAHSMSEQALSASDSHLVTSTETQDVDICLDCQCHGGHATLLGGFTPLAPTPLTDSPVLWAFAYFPPESLPSYRPPIV
jgi:hypothetical protein